MHPLWWEEYEVRGEILGRIWSTSNLESSIPNLSNKQYTGKPFGLYLTYIQNKTTSHTSTEVTLVRDIVSLTWITKMSSQLVFLLPSLPTIDFPITTDKHFWHGNHIMPCPWTNSHPFQWFARFHIICFQVTSLISSSIIFLPPFLPPSLSPSLSLVLSLSFFTGQI